MNQETRNAGEINLCAGLLALLYKLRDCPIFLAELSDAVLKVMNAADRTEHQPGSEYDQTKVQG